MPPIRKLKTKISRKVINLRRFLILTSFIVKEVQIKMSQGDGWDESSILQVVFHYIPKIVLLAEKYSDIRKPNGQFFADSNETHARLCQ
jgi:hypothetical protein